LPAKLDHINKFYILFDNLVKNNPIITNKINK
jgi:hypothetical protein